MTNKTRQGQAQKNRKLSMIIQKRLNDSWVCLKEFENFSLDLHSFIDLGKEFQRMGPRVRIV